MAVMDALPITKFGWYDALLLFDEQVVLNCPCRAKTKHPMSDNAKKSLKLDNGTVSQKFALRSWGPFNLG